MNNKNIYILLILAAGLRFVFFAVSVGNLPPVMDESIMALQSKMIVEDKDSPAAQAKLYPHPPLGRFPLLFMSQPYLFPIDSYFNTLAIWWAPRTAFGIRLIPFLMGLVGTILTLASLWYAAPREKAWPAYILVLFPSSYLLMLKCGYTPPSYVSFMLFIALITIMCLRPQHSDDHIWIWAGATGLLSGLAVASQMIAVPFLIGAFAVYAFRDRLGKSVLAAGSFSVGAIAGFTPILLAKHLYAGAHAAVSGTLPLREAIGRLLEPTLQYTLPTAMGLPCTLFPDSVNRIRLVPGIATFAALLWLAIMLYATILAAFKFFERWRRTGILSVNIFEMLIAVSWMNICMFCLSSRAHSDSFRYLLGTVWALPFVFAFCLINSKGMARKVIVLLALALASANLMSSLKLMSHWSQKDFAATEPKVYDLRPAIDYLKQNGIDRCYANYFDTYRLNYMTDEEIICSQHYNLRFYGWPLPYKEAVDSSPNAAYVLGPSWRFTPEDFERDLELMGASYRKVNCGPASIYTSFSLPSEPDVGIPNDLVSIRASHSESAALFLVDDIYESQWSLKGDGSSNKIFLELTLKERRPISRISLYYNYFVPGQTPNLSVSAFDGSDWIKLATDEEGKVDDVIFRNGHPIYGDREQAFRFDPILTDRIMIETDMNKIGADWTLGEIVLYSPKTTEETK